jgi:hypothetical protein
VSDLNPYQEKLIAEEVARIAALRAQEEQRTKTVEAGLNQLVQQIQEARELLDQAATRVMTLGQELKRQARKDPELSGAHQTFVAGHLRMAGAVQQVVKRTSLMDRALAAAKRHQEDEARRANKQDLSSQHAAYRKKIEAMSHDPISALADLFDEDLD